MKISDHRITIKTLRPSDKGWSEPSNQTHIGLAMNFIDNWDSNLILDGYLVLKDFGVKRVTAYTNFIKRKSGELNAPKIITDPHEKNKEGNYNSLLKAAREGCETLKIDLKSTNILMILCFNEKKELIVILLEFEKEILSNIKNHTNLVKWDKTHNQESIRIKVLNKGDDSFDYIKKFSQFYLDQISVGYSEIFLKDEKFEPKNINDARKKIFQYIAYRQGQSKFRATLLENYKMKCSITNCDVPAALEACHIYPYMGPKTNHPQNGIILRADIHSLYDQGLIYFDENYIVHLHGKLKISSQYKYLDGVPLKNVPKDKEKKPSIDAIKYKLKEINLNK